MLQLLFPVIHGFSAFLHDGNYTSALVSVGRSRVPLGQIRLPITGNPVRILDRIGVEVY